MRHGRRMERKTKIAIVLRADLAAWQQLNVTAYLASGIAARSPQTVGAPYQDASGVGYAQMFGQPVLVYEADAEALRSVRECAVGRGLDVGVYTQELFATGNDDDNRAAVRTVRSEKLDLVGLAVYGPRSPVDKTLKGIRLHP